MNLKQVNDELQSNIFKYLIFYIPKNEITKKEFDSDYLEKWGNKIFYINKDFEWIEFFELNPLQILDKKVLLSNNYFKILELKNELKEDVYIPFYNSYLNLLESNTSGAERILDNIHTDIPNCDKMILNNVKLNFTFLKEHYDKILKLEPNLNQVKTQNKLDLIDFKELSNKFKNNSKTKSVKIKPLIEFIKHEKKEEIVEIIKTHFSDSKGTSLRYLIQFLEDEYNLICDNQNDLYLSFKEIFKDNDIGTYHSVFNIKNFSSVDLKYQKRKNTLLKIFKDALK